MYGHIASDHASIILATYVSISYTPPQVLAGTAELSLGCAYYTPGGYSLWQSSVKKEGILAKTRGGCRFPIKNVGRLQGKNKERGVSSFSQGIERFWQNLGKYYP